MRYGMDILNNILKIDVYYNKENLVYFKEAL